MGGFVDFSLGKAYDEMDLSERKAEYAVIRAFGPSARGGWLSGRGNNGRGL